MTAEPSGTRTDGLLLLEVGLGLVLLAEMVALYWLPRSRPPTPAGWWRPLVPAATFFLILLVERWRRKRRQRM